MSFNLSLKQKKGLLIIVLLLLVLIPSLILVKRSQELREKAAGPVLTEAPDIISLKETEKSSLMLSDNVNSDSSLLGDKGNLKITFAKGVLDTDVAKSQKLTLAILPQTPGDKIVRFSLDIESTASYTNPTSIPTQALISNTPTPISTVNPTIKPSSTPTFLPTVIPTSMLTPTSKPTAIITPTLIPSETPSPAPSGTLNTPPDISETRGTTWAEVQTAYGTGCNFAYRTVTNLLAQKVKRIEVNLKWGNGGGIVYLLLQKAGTTTRLVDKYAPLPSNLAGQGWLAFDLSASPVTVEAAPYEIYLKRVGNATVQWRSDFIGGTACSNVVRNFKIWFDNTTAKVSSNILGTATTDANTIKFSDAVPDSGKFYNIEYSLDAFSSLYAPSTLKFVWLNPDTFSWDSLPTEVDYVKRVIRTKVNHLSDFGVKGEKASVFAPTLKNWETDLYTGAVSHSFPIEVVPGRGGLKPGLAASYNSNRANYLFDEQKGSFLGAGWDLTLPEVRFDSYERNEWTDCNKSAGSRKEGPQYSLVLDGVGGPLVWIGDDAESGRFITKGNARIRGYYGTYRGKTTFGGACDLRKKIVIKWVVTGTNGVEYTFDIGADTQNSPNVANREVEGVLVPTRYMLTKMKDASDNSIEFLYQVPERDKKEGQNLSTYPLKFIYNKGRAAVTFELEAKENAPKKPDNKDKNVEMSRLKKINVFSDTSGNGILYRTYVLNYESMEKFDILKRIDVFGPGLPEAKNKFVPTVFNYELKPVGLESEVLGKEFVGCSGSVEFHAIRVTDLEGNSFFNDLMNKIKKGIPQAQKDKLIKAGFLNCKDGAGVGGCPESAENEFYTMEGVPYGARVTTAPVPCPTGSGYPAGAMCYGTTCLTHTEQGSIISWEKNKAPFLSRVVNGYGGEVTFAYQNMHRAEYGLNKNVIVSKTISDPRFRDKGTPDVTVTYQYHPIVEDGAGRMLNKAGGFGRVTQTDVLGISATTFFYPLAPFEGDGKIDPDKNPFFGAPLRSVVHKVEGGYDKIYSDSFISYSFIPPYDPNFGLNDSDLNKDANRSSWYGTRLIDNLMMEGIGKRVTLVSDSFTPKNASFVSVTPVDNKKPQYIDNNFRKSQFLHSQSQTIYDRYGYPIKTVQLGDVNDNVPSGFNISSTKADLSIGRNATSDESFWWTDSDIFTFGIPFAPVLFTDTAIKKQDNCMPDGWYIKGTNCDDMEWLDICCKTTNRLNQGNCNKGMCPPGDRIYVSGNLVSCNRFAGSQCNSLQNRNSLITNPPVSGAFGSLKKFSYSKYLRDASYLSLNMTGLVSESFGSDIDAPSFDAVSEANRWGWTKNGYDTDGKRRGFVTSVEKKNTFTSREGMDSPDSIITRVEYDNFGNIVAAIDAKGNRSITSYSNPGKVYDNIFPSSTSTEIKNPDGTSKGISVTSSTIYDDLFWMPIKTTDTNGIETKATFDCLGRPQETFKQNPLTGKIESGALASVTNFYFDYQGSGCGLGAVNTVNPSPNLRTRIRISSTGSDNVYTYTDSINDGLGNSHQVIVRKTKVNGADKGLISEVVYNNRGLKDYETLAIEVNPLPDTLGILPYPQFIPVDTLKTGKLTRYTYDELGRTISVTDPLNNTSRSEYFGMVTKSYDANNSKKQNPTYSISEVNGFGQNIKTVVANTNTDNALGLVSYLTYDVAGNVVRADNKKCTSSATCDGGTQEVLSTSSTSFDTLGRKWKVIDPDLGVWKFAYDVSGNLVRQVDAKNQTITFTYDSLNRLVKKQYPGNSRAGMPTVRDFVMYVYDFDADANGNRLPDQSGVLIGSKIRMIDVTGNTRYWYDKRGRVTKDEKALNKIIIGQTGAEVSRNSFEYFDSDSLKATILPTGERVEQRLNEFGQLVGVRGQDEYLSDLQYNLFGSPTKSILGNNLEATRRYDGLGRLARICVAQNCDTQTGELMDYKISARDSVGNILGMNNDLTAGGWNLSYTYDLLYQLKTATGLYSASYNYDPSGNMTRKTEGPETINMGYTDTVHKHAPKVVNGFTYQYDANGNLLEDEARTYVWDFDNKPVKITMKGTNIVTEFAYDGDGSRVLKRVINP